ncbi:isochorismatase [Bacillus coahuilensis m2-6]|uniref:isochorismatase family cysteine hydrolase n=1 Tax=Bacillus coahuilensis TaxID=408580 RepID=UPI00018507C9|nr:isochorismatase family cysteine hydrolase [Bacillus coahuilensis]KUP04112.1 isochorismatase [Bacillus coahuilensis m2-6]
MKSSPKSYALLIIDCINSFQYKDGPLLQQRAKTIVSPILSLKEFAYEHKLPIIYVNDHYNLWKADLETIFEECKTPENKHFLEQLKPNDTDYFLIKPKHSAFYGTALHTLLHSKGIDTLIITGLVGNVCVLFSANDAFMRDFNVIVPSDSTVSLTDSDQEFALKMVNGTLGGQTPNCKELVISLSKGNT